MKKTSRSLSLRFLRALGIAAVLAISSAAIAGADQHPNVRKGWLVGFSGGAGSAGLSGSHVSTERTSGATGTFRGGYAFNEDLSLELNADVWTKEENGTTVTFSAYTAAIDFYPGHSGLVLRAGIGGGDVTATVEESNTKVDVTRSGFGITAGAGYEFRVARTFALGPQVDFGYTDVSDFTVNWVGLGLGFTWYFIGH